MRHVSNIINVVQVVVGRGIALPPDGRSRRRGIAFP